MLEMSKAAGARNEHTEEINMCEFNNMMENQFMDYQIVVQPTREVMVEDRAIIEDGTDTRTKVISIIGCREASRKDLWTRPSTNIGA